MKTKPKKYPDPEMPTNGEICHIVQILLASGRTFPDMATAANEALRIYLQIWKWERHDEGEPRDGEESQAHSQNVSRILDQMTLFTSYVLLRPFSRSWDALRPCMFLRL